MGVTDNSARSSSSLFCGRLYKQLWHGQVCLVSDIVHPASPLPSMSSPTLQGALEDGFGETVVARDMPDFFSGHFEVLVDPQGS